MTRVLLLLQNRFSIVGANYAKQQDQFYYNPCSPINGPKGVLNMGCSVKANTAVCQEDSKILYDCGNQNSMTPWIDKNENVFFNYTFISYEIKKTTAIQLKCDELVSVENSKLTFVSENPPNNYYFILTSKCCCPGACEPNSGTASTGFSLGPILLIVFSCLLIIIFIVGALYIKFRASGSSIAPSKPLWPQEAKNFLYKKKLMQKDDDC
ncbi:uncharacterized protein [Oscarella lobularis]|uniref:uncharacterized protein n=1 Tax=Oscarella lobularis TaxID=121494 RepID=UPI003313BB92